MLISFEGGDRCGKTTEINLLKLKIEEETDLKVKSLKHPNRSTASGKIIDDFLKNKLNLSGEAITMCLASNLWDTSNEIGELLKEGNVVLIDRYIHTNLAYSQIRGVILNKLEKMMEGIVEPDFVIYLRPDTGNVSDRNDFGAERYETVEIQESVQANFNEIFKRKSNVLIINSCNPIEEISEQVWNFVKDLIG